MGYSSHIEWTTHTFNPWWGCTKVSDGCKLCYAESLAKRYGHNVWGPTAERRTLSDAYWQQPINWNTEAQRTGVRARVFCASMADVFEDRAPEGERERLWDLVRVTRHLDWQILTKRPENIAAMLPDDWDDGWRHVWLGTSIEDERVTHRAQTLAQVPAKIRFLSVEPLIGRIKNLPLNGIGWVIVGGESGAGARPMQAEWALEIMEQCADAGVPYFFKQAGNVLARTWGVKGKGNDFDLMPENFQHRQIPELMETEEFENLQVLATASTSETVNRELIHST